jgi:energy-coupling factor transporter transmembrane protein EcfT
VGLALTRSPLDLAVLALVAGAASLRIEGRSARDEAPVWGLAAVVFLAHALLSGDPARNARPAALIALRLLALLYLTRWAARSFLGRAARWALGFPLPVRVPAVALPIESGRHAMALVPLAVREAGRQHEALRARGAAPGRGPAGRARYAAAWLLPFLGTMLRLGESYADALAARGYRMGAARGAAVPAAWGWRESLTVAGAAAGAAWLLHGR